MARVVVGRVLRFAVPALAQAYGSTAVVVSVQDSRAASGPVVTWVDMRTADGTLLQWTQDAVFKRMEPVDPQSAETIALERSV